VDPLHDWGRGEEGGAFPAHEKEDRNGPLGQPVVGREKGDALLREGEKRKRVFRLARGWKNGEEKGKKGAARIKPALFSEKREKGGTCHNWQAHESTRS